MNRIRTAAAGACAVVMLAGPAAVASAAGPVPRPTAPSKVQPSQVKPPPPIKPCRWMWFGNWRLCIRP